MFPSSTCEEAVAQSDTFFSEAPDHWQDFVHTHRATPLGNDSQKMTSCRVDGTSSTLEFQECSLLVGARITLVGELHRGANGSLSIRPWQPEKKASANKPRNSIGRPETWRTSWECGGCEIAMAHVKDSVGGKRAATARSSIPSVLMSKVVVSDDPALANDNTQSVLQSCLLRAKNGDGLVPPSAPRAEN